MLQPGVFPAVHDETPGGLRHAANWIAVNLDRCFQLMEREEAVLPQRWVLQWRDPAEFEMTPVSPSGSVCGLFTLPAALRH